MNIEEQIYSIIDEPNTYIGEASIDVPDCQWIKTAPGSSKVYFGKDTYAYSSYSIYVRNTSNRIAREKVETIYRKVQNYVGNTFSIYISRTPYFLGRDHLDRSIYTFQIEFQIGGY